MRQSLLVTLSTFAKNTVPFSRIFSVQLWYDAVGHSPGIFQPFFLTEYIYIYIYKIRIDIKPAVAACDTATFSLMVAVATAVNLSYGLKYHYLNKCLLIVEWIVE